MGDFIKGMGLVIFLQDHFLEVLGVWTYMEGSIRLLGIRDAFDKFCWSDFWYDDALVNYLLKPFLYP